MSNPRSFVVAAGGQSAVYTNQKFVYTIEVGKAYRNRARGDYGVINTIRPADERFPTGEVRIKGTRESWCEVVNLVSLYEVPSVPVERPAPVTRAGLEARVRVLEEKVEELTAFVTNSSVVGVGK